MGIEAVACLIVTAALSYVTMRSTFRWTNSEAISRLSRDHARRRVTDDRDCPKLLLRFSFERAYRSGPKKRIKFAPSHCLPQR
jgi:hypothetical protein